MNTLETANAKLPPRLKAVFRELILHGRSEKEAAGELNISHHTVHSHIKRIYRTLEVGGYRELSSRILRELGASEIVHEEASRRVVNSK